MSKREALAEYAHDAWVQRMGPMIVRASMDKDGTVTIPKWLVDRFRKTSQTPYDALPEGSKESARAEADKILAIIEREEADQ